MSEYADGPEEELESAPEEADPPRPVRGVLWLFAPGAVGAALGEVWSAYYSAFRGVDPLTPVLVGGGLGLALGAVLWVFFPYKGGARRGTDSSNRGRS